MKKYTIVNDSTGEPVVVRAGGMKTKIIQTFLDKESVLKAAEECCNITKQPHTVYESCVSFSVEVHINKNYVNNRIY